MVERPGSLENRNGPELRRKTTTICFRIENQTKERLQDIAVKEARTLSSLLERILHNFLDYPEGEMGPRAVQEDRRLYRRKKIVLPARWRIHLEEEVVEHDVVVKDISAGGAYTEYINGQNFLFFKNLQVALLELVVRLPGSRDPVMLDCKVKRIHVTKDSVGVGLQFPEIVSKEDHDALKRTLF
jgi:hypothetical protein